MNLEKLEAVRKAIRSEELDGWLFCNFRHRDPLADEILEIGAEGVNSRFWFYAVPAFGPPRRIVHAVEPDALGAGESALPGEPFVYRSREELIACLSALAGKNWGCHFSNTIAAISYLDAGTFAALKEAGLAPCPGEGLIQRLKGLLDEAAIQSHERAAAHLWETVHLGWDMVKRSFAEKKPLYEGEISGFMRQEVQRRGLETRGAFIVAAGRNSANPHYRPAGGGSPLTRGDVVQFDIWAKEKSGIYANGVYANGIYADISWVGVYGETAHDEAQAVFAAVTASREEALRFIETEFALGRRPSGAAVDRAAKQVIAERGFAKYMRHRTGHGIDTDVHGSGVNIDSVEFPDSRLLLDGSCFSIEPGVYLGDFGMRTEINVYIKNAKHFVSGKERQRALLNCAM